MTLVDSIRTCFQKYFDFSGRASRPEFWWFALCAFVAQAVLGLLLPGIAFLVLALPFLAVSARRLHDTGRSAVWLTFYPLAGLAFAVLVVAALAMAFAEELGGDFFLTLDFADVEIAAFTLLLLLGLSAGAVGGILPLILCALPGTVGPNQYGNDPLARQPGSDTPETPSGDPAARTPMVAPETEGLRFCARCGSKLPPDAMFCASCGAAVPAARRP